MAVPQDHPSHCCHGGTNPSPVTNGGRHSSLGGLERDDRGEILFSKVATWLEIDLRQLALNYDLVNKFFAPATVMPVLKSHGYGHGFELVARILMAGGAKYLGVDHPSEGIQLRHLGFRGGVLVLGQVFPQYLPEIQRYNLWFSLASHHVLEPWLSMEAPPQAYLKIDTGLSRQGFSGAELPEVVQRLSEPSYSAHRGSLLGVMSHGSHRMINEHASRDLSGVTAKQVERLEKLVSRFLSGHHNDKAEITELCRFPEFLGLPRDEAGEDYQQEDRDSGHHKPQNEDGSRRPRFAAPSPPFRAGVKHLCSSASALLYPPGRYDLVRIGGLLYGAFSYPQLRELWRDRSPKLAADDLVREEEITGGDNQDRDMEPQKAKVRDLETLPMPQLAITWKGRIGQIKVLSRGDRVGYGGTYEVTDRSRVIATIAVGYSHGLSTQTGRHPQSYVLIGGYQCAIIGEVSMSMMSVDLGSASSMRNKGFYEGQEVVLLGRDDHGHEITLEQLAQWGGRGIYETLVALSQDLPRLEIHV